MRAGAVGYVLKDASKEELANAIRTANSGKTILSPDAADDLLFESTESPIELTDREQEVLALLVQGMSNKEIGEQLHRSPYTIRHHVSQLIKRLDAGLRRAVVAAADGALQVDIAPEPAGQNDSFHFSMVSLK